MHSSKAKKCMTLHLMRRQLLFCRYSMYLIVDYVNRVTIIYLKNKCIFVKFMINKLCFIM